MGLEMVFISSPISLFIQGVPEKIVMTKFLTFCVIGLKIQEFSQEEPAASHPPLKVQTAEEPLD